MGECAWTKDVITLKSKPDENNPNTNTTNSWVGELLNLFTREGLKHATLDRYEMSPAYRRYDNDKSLTAYEEFSRTVLDPRGKGEGEYLRGLIGRASKECQQGVGLTADMVVVVGQK